MKISKPSYPRLNLDIQLQPDPYLNCGFHLDHKNIRVELHFPGFFIAIGNLNNVSYDWSLKRFLRGEENFWDWDRDSEPVLKRTIQQGVTCNDCEFTIYWGYGENIPEVCPNCGTSTGFVFFD